MAPTMSTEEDVADVDEPPDLECTPRPSALKLHESFKASFSKTQPRCERKESLLSTALHSSESPSAEELSDERNPTRGLSCVSTWSNNSASTAELTSDGGLTSPGTRTNTPSPPLPASTFHNMVPIFNKKPFEPRVVIAHHDDEHISPLQKVSPPASDGEKNVEVSLGRKRCITFACGPKTDRKAELEKPKTSPPAQQATDPPKRVCTIKFACPAKVSIDAPSKEPKPRPVRAASPAPFVQRLSSSGKAHRGSDSTVRNTSPVATRKQTTDRTRRLSANSDLVHCEAFRFHEFASSEEEVDEWTLESTCHRQPLTIKDTLKIENNLRQLGEEAEEEAVEEEDDDLAEGDDEDVEEDLDEDEDEDEEHDESDDDDVSSDEGFMTDDEEGFAVSDDESDAGSDYNWWTPGPSTAATSIEHLEHIRPINRRSISESSIGSVESNPGIVRYRPEKSIKRRSSRPVNIRIPSPELPDSTDFVCGTLDEDRPLEEAYLSALERRRAAKHKLTPQDVDPTFPTSDPEMDEEDEDEEADNLASESDAHMMIGQMEPDGNLRGRRRSTTAKRSPLPSPKRLRSPPPAKRAVHRSPPPRKLFGQSPKRLRSPPAPVRLRSPPPTRRGSTIFPPKSPGMHIQFIGLAERPALTTSSSLPRTPVTLHPPEFDDEDDEDTPHELPMRRAIDIKVGLEKRRQRRKEQLYKKMQRKGTKDKRPPPGKGCERMREVGLGLAAHKGKATGFGFHVPPTPDQKDMRILSV